MFVDASAIIAILTNEPDGKRLSDALEAAGARRPITSVLATWEATVGLFRKKRMSMADAEAGVLEFLAVAGVELVPNTAQDLSGALHAFDRYGRHRYPDSNRNNALNLADCFHYATTQSYRTAPILTTDAGFALTDIETLGTKS